MKINTEIKTRQEANALIEKLQNFSEPLDFGRWIVDDGFPNWMVMYDNVNNLIYGLDSKGDWFCNVLDLENPSDYRNNRYATEEEILSKLSKVAVKLGFVEGAKVNLYGDFWGRSRGGEKGVNTLGAQKFSYYNDNLNYKVGESNLVIMYKGEWAKIIKEPKTDKERIEILEKQVKSLQEKIRL